MKKYATSPRKPMMYGGASMRPKRKMQTGGATAANADTQSRLATGRATAKDKALAQQQRIEELGRMPITDLRRIAEGTGTDAMLARKVLRDKGDEGAMPSGDKEPAGKMYGGTTGAKQMAMKGKTTKGRTKMMGGGKTTKGRTKMMGGGKTTKGRAMMAKGGKMPMVKKNGKMVPAFAADGKGKMMGGGKATKGRAKAMYGGKKTKGMARGGRGR